MQLIIHLFRMNIHTETYFATQQHLPLDVQHSLRSNRFLSVLKLSKRFAIMVLNIKSKFAVNWVYYALCLGFFVWQSTLISINFFQFQTVSMINFAPPGEESVRPTTICLPQHQLTNVTLLETLCDQNPFCGGNLRMPTHDYLRSCGRSLDYCKLMIVESLLNLKDRFQLTYNMSNFNYNQYIHNKRGNSSYPEMYILGKYICYQMSVHNLTMDDSTFRWTGDVTEPEKEPMIVYRLFGKKRLMLENVTDFRLAIAPEGVLPHFEFFTTDVIDFKENGWKQVDISSYSYEFSKLKPPYVDACVDYKLLGFLNRLDAVSDCLNEGMFRKYGLSRMKIFDFSSYHDGRYHKYANYTLSITNDIEKSNECYKRYPSEDCHSELTYTDIDKITGSGHTNYSYSIKRIAVRQLLSTKASYKAENHAQIDPVDFVTYIFGAAGTWFGFSFMTIEPVPLIEWIIEQVKKRNKISITTNAQGVRENKHNIESLTKMLEGFKEEMNAIKSDTELMKNDTELMKSDTELMKSDTKFKTRNCISAVARMKRRENKLRQMLKQKLNINCKQMF